MTPKASTNQSIYQVLVLCEILAVTSAGVFGNLIANLVKMSPTWVLFGSAVAVLICFFVTIQRLQFENDKENYSLRFNIKFKNLSDETTKREAFIFPIALLFGIVVGFISTTLFSKEDIVILETRLFDEYRYLSWHEYELFSYPFAGFLIYLFNRYMKDVVLVFVFSVAYTIGLLGTFLLYRPEQNDIVNMLLNFGVIMIFTAIVRSRIIEVFFEDVRLLWKNLMEK